jgi:hypothetical protein
MHCGPPAIRRAAAAGRGLWPFYLAALTVLLLFSFVPALALGRGRTTAAGELEAHDQPA